MGSALKGITKHGAIAQVMDWDDDKKSDKPKTEEEREKARAEKAEDLASRKRVITGGITKGGSRNEYVGTEVLMNPNGNGFTFGPVSSDPSANFKWNERTGDYRSHGGGILEVANVAASTPEESSGGGGGSNPSPGPGPQKPVTIVDEYDTIIPGSEGILGGYDNMVNWEPISSNGNGGAGLNPLVDPDEWMVNLPEINMGKQTRQWIPNKRFYGGLI